MLSDKINSWSFWLGLYKFWNVLYQFLETGTSDKTNIGWDQLLKCLVYTHNYFTLKVLLSTGVILPGNVILKIIYPCQIQDGEAGSPIYDELRIQGFNPTFLREGNEEEKDNVLVRNKWEMFKWFNDSFFERKGWSCHWKIRTWSKP